MYKKTMFAMFLSFFAFFSLADEQSESLTTEEEKYIAWAQELWNGIEQQQGEISIDKANALLNVPENFYYLNAKDSKKVLVDVWGNPPGQSVLGMLFPANSTPFDSDSWAVTIEYEEDGYISDEDAHEIDYSDLLSQMKDDTKEASKLREKEGYGSIELIGWASPPYYDSSEKKLYWAKELNFNKQDVNTLNYNIRVLGRKGVLVLNFIAGMNQKAIIDNNLETVLAIADFQQGSKYSDFDPEIDKVAAYGLGALVAGKILAKTGFLALLIVLLKKFGVFIVIGVGALIKRIFSKKKQISEQ